MTYPVLDFTSDTSALRQVVDALQAIIQKNSEVGQAWAKTSAQIDANNKVNVTGTTTLGKSIENLAVASKTLDKSVIGGAYKDYLVQIQKQLGLTSKELIAYIQNARQAAQAGVINAETDEQAEQLTLTIQVMNEKLKELGVSEDAVGNKTQSLKAQMMAMRNELANLEEGTPEFEALRIKAGELDDKIKDLNATIAHTGSDTQNIDGLVSLASGVAGGFAAAQGAAALFGDENEDLQKALLKVQAAMSILQGLQQLAIVLQKESSANIFLNTLFRKANTAATAEGTVAMEADALATEADATAKTVQSTATKGAAASQGVLNLAMLASPAGIVLLVIAELVGLYKIFTSASDKAAEAQKQFNLELEFAVDLNEKYIEAIGKAGESNIANLKKQGASAAAIRTAENSAIKEQIRQTENVEASKRKQFEETMEKRRQVKDGLLDLNAEEIKDLEKTKNEYERIQLTLIDLRNKLELKSVVDSTEADKENFKEFEALQNARVAKTIAGSDAEKAAQINAIREVAKEREKTAEFKSLDPNAQALARAEDEKKIQGLQLSNYQHYLQGRTAAVDAQIAEEKSHRAKSDAEQIASINKLADLQIAAIKKQRSEALSNPTLNAGEIKKINDEANLATQEAEKKKQADILAFQKAGIEQQLEAVRKGSEQENVLKLQKIENERQAEIVAAGKNADLIARIDEKYRKLRADQDRAYDIIRLQDEVSLDNAALDQFGITEEQKLVIVLKRLNDQKYIEIKQADGNAKKIAEVNAKYEKAERDARVSSIDVIARKQIDALKAYTRERIAANERIVATENLPVDQKINALESIRAIKNQEVQLEFDALEKKKGLIEDYDVQYQILLNKQFDISQATEQAITQVQLKEVEKRIAKVKSVFDILQKGLSSILPQDAFSTALTQIQNFAISAVDSFKKLQVQKEALDKALAKAARPDATSEDIANAAIEANKTAATQEESNQQMRVLAVQAGQSIINQIYADSAAHRQEQLEAELSALEDQKSKELSNTKLTAQQKADVETRYREKERQVKIQAFEADKRAKITQAIINGLLAGTAALPNLVLSALAVGASIVAAAQIAAQPTPRFKKGKIDIDGPGTTTSDSIPAFISKHESVIAAQPTLKWKEALVAINEDKFEGYLSMKLRDFEFPRMPELGQQIRNITNNYYRKDANNHYSREGIDYKKLADAIAERMPAMPEIPQPKSVHVNIDKDGIRTLVHEGTGKTEYKNKRYSTEKE